MEVDYSSTMDIENEIGAYTIATVAIMLLRSDFHVHNATPKPIASVALRQPRQAT